MLRSAAPTARRSLLHLVVALATTWPLVLHIGHRVPLGDEDVATVPLFNLWSLRWTATTLPLHPSRWWDAPIFWPTRGAYARSELQPLTGLVFSAVRSVLGDVAAYDIVLLASLAACGLTAAAAARQLGVSPTSALVVGVLAQTTPFLFQQIGVLQLTMLWPLWAAIWCLLRWNEHHSHRSVVGFAGCLAASLATCGYFFVLFLLAVAPAALALAVPHWRTDRRAVISSGVLAGALVGASCAPILNAQRAHLPGARWSEATIRAGSATWTQVAPGGAHWPGTALVVLAGAGLITTRRSRSTIFLGALTAMALLTALGPHLDILGWHPWSTALQRIGVLAALRSPFRSIAFVEIGLLLLAGLGLDAVRRRVPRLAWLITLVPLLVAGHGPGRLYEVPERRAAWSVWLSEHPGGAVVMLPMAPGRGVADFEQTTIWMLAALEHGHPLLNGYSGFFPLRSAEQRALLNRFPSAEAVAELRHLGVEYVVADGLWWTSERQSAAVSTGLEVLRSGPDATILKVVGT